MAATGIFAGGVNSIVVPFVVLGAALVVLNLVAVAMIITKAGRSGWWMLLVLAPFILDAIGYAQLDNSLQTGNYNSGDYMWFVIGGIAVFVQWIFFLIFAFSEWPVRRQLKRLEDQLSVMRSMSPQRTVAPPAHAPEHRSVVSPAPISPATVPVGVTGGALLTSAVPPPPPPARRQCPTCTNMNRSSSQFCGQCGTRLT
jgi:uncharacterized membrane protein YhaH (DUF805 family)